MQRSASQRSHHSLQGYVIPAMGTVWQKNLRGAASQKPYGQQDLGVCDLYSPAAFSVSICLLSPWDVWTYAGCNSHSEEPHAIHASKNFLSNISASFNQEAKLSILLTLMTLDFKYSNCLIQKGPGSSAGLFH